jgi:hypothetical protein
MVSRRPDGIEITAISPGGVAEDIEEFDHIIVSGLWGYSPRELNMLQDFGDKTTFWVHDSQFAGHWFYTAPKNLIFVSPTHIQNDLKRIPNFPDKRVHVNPGWMDVNEIFHGVTRPMIRKHALWAHRPAGHKGLDLAVDWAKENNVLLNVVVGRPRSEVIQQMWYHRYFVLLSHIFDSGPRAVIEAQLTGAELIINDNVGWYDEPVDELAERVSRADKDFWEVVLS